MIQLWKNVGHVFLFLLPQVLSAQYTNVRVSGTTASGKPQPEEVTIAINPTNPLNLIAGANIW